MDQGTARAWALEEFGGIDLGDARLRSRAIAVGAEALRRPDGRISEVFADAAARQGAYDLVENRRAHTGAFLRASQSACAERASDHRFVFVPVDGTSVTLTDRTGEKGFGRVGAGSRRARGLKVVTALAVSPEGVPLGLATLQWWTRSLQTRSSPAHRKPADRETQHWIDAVQDVTQAFKGSTRAWFQIDREGDAWRLLRELSDSGQLFTVRTNGTRRLEGEPRRYLRPWLRLRKPMGHVLLEVPKTAHRRARLACMAVRARSVTLDLYNDWSKTHRLQKLNVVHVREVGRVPHGEKPLDWMLLTNAPIRSKKEVDRVIFGYTQRWRIEDFHKTWKSGACNVQRIQLRRRAHVTAWATMLAAVAARIERLKHLAREEPTRPATEELSAIEARTLVLLARKYKKRTETVPDVMTMAEATEWIARLGGYTGKSSGGPPGSITIGRGLKRLAMAAEGVELVATAKRPPKKR
jgi:hypothetical protein